MQFHAKRVIKVKSAARPACSRGSKCGGSTSEGRRWPKYKETIATQPGPGEELRRLAALRERGKVSSPLSPGREAKLIYLSIDLWWLALSFCVCPERLLPCWQHFRGGFPGGAVKVCRTSLSLPPPRGGEAVREAFYEHVERTRVVNPQRRRLSFALLSLFISGGNLENARSEEATGIRYESQRVS